jgi:hypothetical protein
VQSLVPVVGGGQTPTTMCYLPNTCMDGYFVAIQNLWRFFAVQFLGFYFFSSA